MVCATGTGKISGVAILGILAVIALLIYAPIAIVQELRRSKNEELPEWMGSARGRKLRLAIIFGVLGLIGLGIIIASFITD